MEKSAGRKSQDVGEAAATVPASVAKPKLVLRIAKPADVGAIAELSKRVYGPEAAYSRRQVRGQINNFSEGQFVAEYDGKVVGHAATFVISGRFALKPHSWTEITGNGYASRHDPDGDYLYGMEVSVDPRYRRLRIGQRRGRPRRDGAMADARDQSPGRVQETGRVLRRRRLRLPKATSSSFRSCSRCSCCRSRKSRCRPKRAWSGSRPTRTGS
jgi:hypothetical protein